MGEISIQIYLLLLATGFAGGFVDSIAGGGGLISVPVLLAVGFPPHLALGTNKLQSSFGSLTASLHYSRKGLVEPRRMLRAIALTALGAALGTIIVQHLSSVLLAKVMPILLLAVLLYALVSPRLGTLDTRPRLGAGPFAVLFGLLLGFYDGFFGPGVGSVWMLAFVLFRGLNLKRATGHTKVVNCTSNVVSLIAWALAGHVLLAVGVVMGIGQVCGATLGARLTIRRGVGFVRGFFLAVVALTIAKLIYSTYF